MVYRLPFPQADLVPRKQSIDGQKLNLVNRSEMLRNKLVGKLRQLKNPDIAQYIFPIREILELRH